MSSLSLDIWTTDRRRRLDEVEAAHARVGGAARGRRYATQQPNRGYALLLAAEFQGFCRQFHSECATYVRNTIEPAAIRPLLQTNLHFGRLLDKNNATPSSIGADFGRFGVTLWDELYRLRPRAREWNKRLETLNKWRNAIVREGFVTDRLFVRGRDTQLSWIQRCAIIGFSLRAGLPRAA
jgi:hypothetical protein